MQHSFWQHFLQHIVSIPFDDKMAQTAVNIQLQLKSKRKSIEKADLFIAATALSNDIVFATLNRKHFENIDGLHLF